MVCFRWCDNYQRLPCRPAVLPACLPACLPGLGAGWEGEREGERMEGCEGVWEGEGKEGKGFEEGWERWEEGREGLREGEGRDGKGGIGCEGEWEGVRGRSTQKSSIILYIMVLNPILTSCLSFPGT